MPQIPKNNRPPRPKGKPILGNLFDLGSPNRLEWIHQITKKHGDVVNFNLLSLEAYFINHPDLVRHVLVTNRENYSKASLAFTMIKEVMGNSIFISNGDTWLSQRRLMQPGFHKTRIGQLGQIMVDTTQEMLETWEKYAETGTAFDAAEEMVKLTLRILTKSLFSTALTEEEIQKIATVFFPILEETNQRISYPIPILYKLPTKKNKAYIRNIADLDAIINRIIKERRSQEKPASDLLQMLMEAKDEETGKSLSDEELRNEIITILIAGHETTANALAWVWVFLSKHPLIRQQVQKELTDTLNGRLPKAADFSDLSYLTMVFKETLRLYPPIPLLARMTEKEDTLGGFFIPAGTEVYLSPHHLHRLPAFWDNPEGFDPTRFTREKERTRHSMAYLPFGGGPRMCLGLNFALLEAVLIIATVSQRFELDLISESKIEPFVSLTTRPKNGVWVRLKKRKI